VYIFTVPKTGNMLNNFKKPFYVLLLATLVTGTPATAQTAEDSIKAVISKMFTGMKESDSNMVKSCFADGAFLQTFSRNKEGKTVVRTETVSDFAKMVASIPKGAADEQVVFKDIKTDGAMAAVWTPYTLYFNGKFYSCGVNSFQLVRLSNEWKIQYILDTRRKDNCE
jgi:hypothetical protein